MFLLLLGQVGLAQKGGESTYSFLGLANSARVAALGGEVVSLMDDDINLVFHNPALLSPGMHSNLSLNYVNYFAGVNYGYASYAYSAGEIGNFAAGMHYVNYGTFDRTDELIEGALELVTGCDCAVGCPACVGPRGESRLDGRGLSTRLLRLLATGESPERAPRPVEAAA